MESQQHSTNHAATISGIAFSPRMDELAALLRAQAPERTAVLLDDLEQQEHYEVARINEQLRKAIVNRGESYYALAKRAGVDAVVISRFVCGERDLRLDTAAKLAAALGLELTVKGA